MPAPSQPYFVGPLPASLMRDEGGQPRLKWSYPSAEAFVLAAADLLRVNGRPVDIERKTDHGYESIAAVSIGEHWYQHPIYVSAIRREGNKRWRFAQAMTWGLRATSGTEKTARTYRAAKILVEVYGT